MRRFIGVFPYSPMCRGAENLPIIPHAFCTSVMFFDASCLHVAQFTVRYSQ